jgi:nicotinate phosphoribosyltransferase
MLSPDFSSLRPQDYGLLTDLYQFTMAACYVGEGLESQPAAFELFVRRLPTDYGYLIAMGLTQAVDYLQQLSFAPEALRALRETGIFADAPERFWELLARCRFEGDVWAVPEGTAIFANQPLLRVEAPLWQAQLVETYLLSTFNYQTLIATKAARMRDAAGDEAILLEFGTRRAFGPQAGLWAARAALAAGFNATSNVLAALKLGRKPAGTMAHSLVMAIAALSGDETRAFQSFRRYFPQAALLIDTYDPIQGGAHSSPALCGQKPRSTGIPGGNRRGAHRLGRFGRSLSPGETNFASRRPGVRQWGFGRIRDRAPASLPSPHQRLWGGHPPGNWRRRKRGVQIGGNQRDPSGQSFLCQSHPSRSQADLSRP